MTFLKFRSTKPRKSVATHRRPAFTQLAWLVLLGWQCLGPGALAQPVTKAALLRDVVRQVIVPDHQALAATCRQLTADLEQLGRTPTPEALTKARQTWLAASLASRRVQWLQSGPMADHEYLATFYYAKVLPLRLEGVLNSTPVIDEARLAELGASTKGMFALEYLLFEPRSEASAKEVNPPAPDLKTWFGTNGPRRCEFLVALAKDVQQKAARVAADWASTNQDAVAAPFLAGGQTTLNRLVNELAGILETVAETHLNFALQLPAPVARQWDRIEGARSRTSVAQLVAMLRGAHQAYRAGEGTGIDDYLRGLNPSLEQRVEQQFQKTFSALQAIDAPLEVALAGRPESVTRAYQAARELEILFKVDLASALGVTITIHATDGD